MRTSWQTSRFDLWSLTCWDVLLLWSILDWLSYFWDPWCSSLLHSSSQWIIRSSSWIRRGRWGQLNFRIKSWWIWNLHISCWFLRGIVMWKDCQVILESLPPPLTCEVVEIAPLSANDYQIIVSAESRKRDQRSIQESGTDVIENGLLSQLRVVSHRARFVFFMSKSLSAAFRVG